MAKSLHEYTVDELLAEVRRRTVQVPSNAAQPDIYDCGCAAGYQYQGCPSAGCPRRTFTDITSAGIGYV